MTDEPVSEAPARPVIKQCPNCGATIFQGPFHRGEVRLDGTMPVVRETVYQCMGCNNVSDLDHLRDH